ncbi:PBECR4 domain-containing protein [Avibacterium avium]|uniref:PBECR4 domain-containing protein n=1 Tax=Avibacterium avium TaxID=751 RepID=UPI003BF7FBDB
MANNQQERLKKYINDIYQIADFLQRTFINKEVVYKTKHVEISIYFRKSNFMHLCGIKYKEGAKAFFESALSKSIDLSKVEVKDDGTTFIKLKLLKYIPLIITDKATLSTEHSLYLHLSFDAAIKAKQNKNQFAITLINDNAKFIPNSLLNTSKINQFPVGDKIIEIYSLDYHSKGKYYYLLSRN